VAKKCVQIFGCDLADTYHVKDYGAYGKTVLKCNTGKYNGLQKAISTFTVRVYKCT
jgi:hypothetical protein